MGRREGKERDPDLGMLAVGLLFTVQGKLFRRSAEHGFADIGPRHGAVLAYLDDDGVRLSDLARLSGRNKQVICTIIDELEGLGYLRRIPDPADRRAKLVVPTRRGSELMRVSDALIAEIEERYAAAVGDEAYAAFKKVLRLIVTT